MIASEVREMLSFIDGNPTAYRETIRPLYEKIKQEMLQ